MNDEPNPVRQIIVTRGAQTSVAALAALAGLRALVPAERFARIVPIGGALVAGGLSAYFVATFTARVPLGPTVYRIPAEDDAVALTFDDGPHPDTTPRLLGILAEHDAHATFFLLGESVARWPELARRIHDAGHTIGIHGLRHRTMVLQSAGAIASDIRETRRRIEDATGVAMGARLLRPPYGFKTATVHRVAKRLGFQIVAWSVDPRDYDPISAATLRERVVSRVRPGDIVLLHERFDRSTTLDTLPEILTELRTRGLGSVAIGR